MLDAGADVNAQTRSRYGTILALAVHAENAEIVKLILEAGADVNAKVEDLSLFGGFFRTPDDEADDSGRTALSIAMETGNEKIIDLLRAAGAKDTSSAASQSSHPTKHKNRKKH